MIGNIADNLGELEKAGQLNAAGEDRSGQGEGGGEEKGGEVEDGADKGAEGGNKRDRDEYNVPVPPHKVHLLMMLRTIHIRSFREKVFCWLNVFR